MTQPPIDPLAPEKTEDAVPRDQWGRPKILQPDGSLLAYTRCTTFVKALEGDASALAQWKQRMTALGLSARPDLLMAVATSGDGNTPDSKKALNKIVEAAAEAAAASSAATIGTALHKFTERLDKGEPIGQVPAAFQADIAAYQRLQLRAVQAEQFGVHDQLRVAGTWDRLNELAGHFYIGDVKTGRVDDLSIGKIAMQLSIYSRCKLYDPGTGQRTEQAVPVDQDRAIIISLPAGSGRVELFWVDIATGWQAVQLASKARGWQQWAKMKNLAEPFTMADVQGMLPGPRPVHLVPGQAPEFVEPQPTQPMEQITLQPAPGQQPDMVPLGYTPPDPQTMNITQLAAAVTGQLSAQDAAARALQQQQVAAAGRGTPGPDTQAALVVAIRETPDVGALMDLWQRTGAGWTQEHKDAASMRKMELENG